MVETGQVKGVHVTGYLETRPFGPPELGISIAPLGVGAWPWGSTWYWGYGKSYGEDDVRGAFEVSLDAGVTLFDTAEVYGRRGASERILGGLVGELGDSSGESSPMDSGLRRNEGTPRFDRLRASSARPFVATKYMPLPWRWRAADVPQALRASLRRLGLERVDLYQIHWPVVPARLRLGQWVEGLIRAHGEGLVGAVGVSNFDAELMERAHEMLLKAGIPLASNQLPYSLLDRHIEQEGLLDACKKLGVTVIAYSPIAEGLLTGKYTPDDRPAGYRGWRLRKKVAQAQPIVEALREIGSRHEGKTPSQVALRWLIQKGSLPIPGAKTARQARDNAGRWGGRCRMRRWRRWMRLRGN